MPIKLVMHLILLITGILSGLPAGGPIPLDILDDVAHELILAHRSNGIPVRPDVDVFYIKIPPKMAGALGGSDCISSVGLSSRMRDRGPQADQAMITMAHEMAHTVQGYMCKGPDAEEAAEAAGYEALAKAGYYADLLKAIRRRLAIIYYHDTRDTAFLVKAGFSPDAIQDVQTALRLMGEERYTTYYKRALPNIFQAARYGRPLYYQSFGGQPLVLDDLGRTLEAFGLIRRPLPPKAVRMAEMP